MSKAPHNVRCKGDKSDTELLEEYYKMETSYYYRDSFTRKREDKRKKEIIKELGEPRVEAYMVKRNLEKRISELKEELIVHDNLLKIVIVIFILQGLWWLCNFIF